jgi:Tol biopolymer transport system component
MPSSTSPRQRALTRITFEPGLQIGATWSPDGRFIAYSTNRGGKFDIWVQQVSGGDPVQVTHGQAQYWQPDWSPDGKYIVYRSEGSGGGIFIIPALGGTGLERKISSFGYYPRWSPDNSRVLFQTSRWRYGSRFYVVDLDGGQPREVLGDFLEQRRLGARSAAWHPDGKRISVWTWNGTPGVREEAAGASGGYFPQEPGFWTVSVAQGSGIKTELGDELNTVSQQGQREWEEDQRFNWSPSGDAIYFERTVRGARNLWKAKIDPLTLKAISIDRLTTDSGLDSNFAVSRDGRRVAFTSETVIQRLWLFPFDAVLGRLTGDGKPITPPGTDTYFHTLTRDGTKLAFSGTRGGHWLLWEKSLPDGQESPINADDYVRDFPSWSPDGKRLAYFRLAPSMDTEKEQVLIWSAETRIEEPLAGPIPVANRTTPYDWSPDGKDLLVSAFSSQTHLFEIWRWPAVPLGQRSAPPRKLASDSYYDLWQPHLSNNAKWLVMVGSKANTATGPVCRLLLVPGSVGPVTPLLDSGHWDDKPRWSPDGKTIYFLSDRQGFFDVWGIRFDQIKGETVGKAFLVSHFDSPDLTVPQDKILTELSISRNKLVVNLSQRSGSIWVLDDVDN